MNEIIRRMYWVSNDRIGYREFSDRHVSPYHAMSLHRLSWNIAAIPHMTRALCRLNPAGGINPPNPDSCVVQKAIQLVILYHLWIKRPTQW